MARSGQSRSQTRSRKQGSRSQSKGISTAEELFKHELKDIYSGEHLLLEALEELEQESEDYPELAEAFARHREQTEGHIERLERIGELIGEELEQAECPGIEGLIEEKKAFSKEKPTPEILSLFNVGAAQKTERYEITAYEGLIELAEKIGQRDAIGELKANLNEEEAALKKLKGLSGEVKVPVGSGQT